MSFQRNQIRVNHRIRATEVRVVSSDGGQLGVLPIAQALKMASERGLDLVEVSPDSKPPVCRLVDFGKFRYEQAKKHKGESHHSHASKLKELVFHVNIGENDYAIKVRHAVEFLQKGMRVKISLRFRGREMAHKEFGVELINRIIQDTIQYGHTDSEPRLIGKNLHAILVPGKAKPKVATPLQNNSHPVHKTASAAPSPSNYSHESPKPFGAPIKIELKPAATSSKMA